MEDRFGADYVHQMRLIRSYARAMALVTKHDSGRNSGRLAALDAMIEWTECEIMAYGEKV
jgi:hypothetical protein